MYGWPKEDPKYDQNKSRAENYQILHKIMENYVEETIKMVSNCNEIKAFMKERWYKGAHLDWNYTEMLRDLIDQGLVNVPITDFDVIFVEWASGSLDNAEDSQLKGDKALYDWNGNQEDELKPSRHRHGINLWWDKVCDSTEVHKYNDSNREEFIPTSETNETTQPTSPVEHQQSTDTSQAMAQSQQQPVQVQYGGNQYIVPAQQQHKSWIPNVDYVDPNFIPEWERELMMKEAMMGAQGRALMKQMGMIPQYQPPQYQTVQPLPQQPPRFTSPEQVVSYILANQPDIIYDDITNESINNALEGTFIGADDQ